MVMSCENPKLAINLGKFDGKYKIRFARISDGSIYDCEERYGSENVLLLPCGHCPSCKAAHQREWAVRCALESGYYKDSCMITLTYDDNHAPRKLIKRDLQDFIKDMRNRGIKFRYFGCGEYGTKNCRPHYHLIMFGYWPKDAFRESTSNSGNPVYRSRFVDSVWKKGLTTVSEMSPGTAAYVAGYVDKKLGFGEFSLMSKRPGIGERYFREHLFDLFAYDNLVGAFGVAKLPRYCDKLAEKNSLVIDDVKEKRKKAANSNLIDLMNAHGIDRKDLAVGYRGKQMHDKLVRKERL